jgi:hypothetical protein
MLDPMDQFMGWVLAPAPLLTSHEYRQIHRGKGVNLKMKPEWHFLYTC